MWVQSAANNSLDHEVDSAKGFGSDAGSEAKSDTDTDTDIDTDTDSARDAIRATIPTYEEWIVSPFRHEPTWTGLLRDSPETATVAIVSGICLCMNHKPIFGEQCCLAPRGKPNGTYVWSPGDPLPETSLLINEDLLKDVGLRRCYPKANKRKRSEGTATIKQAWDIKDLRTNSKFSLGIQGSLKLYRRIEDQLIMDWSPALIESWRDGIMNEKFPAKRGHHHQEYIRGDWAMPPLPVIVRSIDFHEDLLSQ